MYLSCTQAQKNHVECVSALLCFPAVTDLRDSEGRTAVMWAAQRGNYNALQAMLEKGLSASTADTSGATGNDHPPTLHTLCTHTHSTHTHHTHTPHTHSTHTHHTLHTALHAASLSGHASCVQLLVQVSTSSLYITTLTACSYITTHHTPHSMSLYNHPPHSQHVPI